MSYLNIYEKKKKQAIDFLRSSIMEYSDYDVILKRYTGKDEIKARVLNTFKDSLYFYLKKYDESVLNVEDPKFFYDKYSFCVQYFNRYYRSFIKYRDILDDFGLQLFSVDHFNILFDRYHLMEIQLIDLINHFDTK